MTILKNIICFFRSFFEYISFRTKPDYTKLDDDELNNDYDFIIFNENMIRN